MKRLLLVFSILFLAVDASAYIVDAPHNDTNDIDCIDCHNYSLWWRYSPSTTNQTPGHKAIVDTVCARCHTPSSCAPVYPGHSGPDVLAADLHNPLLPDDWSRACTDCHNPHRQSQLEWASSFSDDLYLVTGDIQAPDLFSSSSTSPGCDGNDTTFDITQIRYTNDVSNWAKPRSSWIAKNDQPGRGLILAISAPGDIGPVTQPVKTFEVISETFFNQSMKFLSVRGKIYEEDPENPGVNLYKTQGGSFGLFYGQLIRDRVNNSPVKFFDPEITPDSNALGGLANSTTFEGLCQVCHTIAKYWTFDNQCRDLAGNVITCQKTPDQHNSEYACVKCHKHEDAFGGAGHASHEDRSGFTCSTLDCHGAYDPPYMADGGATLANTTVCDACHNNGTCEYDAQGNLLNSCPPNVTDYKDHFLDDTQPDFDPNAYVLGCFGCHNGMPEQSNDETVLNMGSTDCDPLRSCKDCHGGVPKRLELVCVGALCSDCHNGSGSITGLPNGVGDVQKDLQRLPVGMQTAGHRQLVSTAWIRNYPCYYCHKDTVDLNGKPLPGGKHLNSLDLNTFARNGDSVDVDINSQWDIDPQKPAYYTDQHHPPDTGAGEVADSCYNTYCHSDGTTLNPQMFGYPWNGQRQECYACHGHAPTSNCSAQECHGPDDTRSWDDYPDKSWLAAMPMYKNFDINGNPLTGVDGANSHYRHLFSGLSCDECHYETVVGDCLDCHDPEALQNEATTMGEKGHVNPAKHITDRTKTVTFQDPNRKYNQGGNDMSCVVECHSGVQPVWGGSVLDSITCKACHGVNGDVDVDDFAAFNGIRAKINLDEWSTTGHGRPLGSGSYDSGNPPAAFPPNGCWYCHDNKVLHQVEERPFRLIQHDQFNQRFEKECVFCHMVESDTECLGCHNIDESLAPQLDLIAAESGIIPLYGMSQPDHSTFNDILIGSISGDPSCINNCHINDETRHSTEAGVWSQDQKSDIKNSYLQMGVCLKCHDDDNEGVTETGEPYSQCFECHKDDPLTPEDEREKYVLGYDPKLPGTYLIKPQQAKAASFHFGHKHYSDYVESLAVHTVESTVSETLAVSNKLVDSSMNWAKDTWYGYYVKMFDGPNIGQIRKITGNSPDTLFIESDFSEPVQAGNIYKILIEGGTVSEIMPSANELRDSSKTWMAGQWKGYLVEMNQGPQFDSGSASDTSTGSKELIDTLKSWQEGKWKGYSLHMMGGMNADEIREIKENTNNTLHLESPFPAPVEASDSYEIIRVDRRRITGNDTDTVQVATDFSYPINVGDTFTIIMPNWRGGKFCWDCHDPHGDQNLYMIQNMVATRTDGWVGRPIARAEVSFTTKQNRGLSYARTSEPYDGICNVCHTEAGQHYSDSNGDGHMSGRICTECHEHRFTESHASQQNCNKCHDSRPVPRHSGFSQPRECIKCHDSILGKRIHIMGQFRANSHHIQGIDVENTHCYACHWEADEHGLIDRRYHQGFNNKDFSGDSDREVDLVIWGSTSRPTDYELGVSAVQFTASKMLGSTSEERAEVNKITPHCLGCHNETNKDTEPFGDCKTPRQYSWDGSSVAERYGDTSTTTWGKYPDTANAAQKNITKAFSAHGNAVNNGGGFSHTDGVDGVIPNTRPGAKYNVQCFDCHNSHGSNVSGVTSSYISFNGDQNGANLKETQGGKGGYAMTYMASSYTDPQSVNYYEAGAGQCFDCHETQNAGVTPWGYESTFEAQAPIMGYADTLRFGQGTRGVASRYSFKKSTIVGGHMKPSSSIATPPLHQISGLCTPCHDPHGVSKSLAPDQAYGVPLLKGTWMTSPYKEDAPLDGALTGRRDNLSNQKDWDRWLPREPGPEPIPYVHTDQKTFESERIKETDQVFAGLCLSCHPKSSLLEEVDLNPDPLIEEWGYENNDNAWKSIDRVHESVRGWGDNEMHSYSCSKCHRPHNSTLPRLMKTNCLNVTHRGRVASGGDAGSNAEIEYYHSGLENYRASFPYGKNEVRNIGDGGNYRVNCHPTGIWPDNSWNEVSPW